MPPFQYINQTAPFWDFVASLEQQGSSHPFFQGRSGDSSQGQEQPGPQAWGPWRWDRPPFYTHPRAPPVPPPPFPGGAPVPPHSYPPPYPPTGEAASDQAHPPDGNAGTLPASPTGEQGQQPQQQPSGEEQSSRSGWYGRRGHCGRGQGFRHGRFRNAFWSPENNTNNNNMGFNLADLASLIQRELFGAFTTTDRDAASREEDFTPVADIFDTPTAYHIHVSLPGAKKEDVGVNWDPEKSEISIAGVIYRHGDEEFLKTIAVEERKVGAFQRRIRLGSRANPAQVDEDAIIAHLEDGVLRIEVPKLDKDYVEIKKVDIM